MAKKKFPKEVRERAVRFVEESLKAQQYGSTWEAIRSIAPK